MKCPDCGGSLTESKGSPVSPYINVYSCGACGWHKLRCGNSSCDGYMEAEYMGVGTTYHYTCVTCSWTGTGVAFA